MTRTRSQGLKPSVTERCSSSPPCHTTSPLWTAVFLAWQSQGWAWVGSEVLPGGILEGGSSVCAAWVVQTRDLRVQPDPNGRDARSPDQLVQTGYFEHQCVPEASATPSVNGRNVSSLGGETLGSSLVSRFPWVSISLNLGSRLQESALGWQLRLERAAS